MLSNICLFSTLFGEDFQFDEGWNHQLDEHCLCLEDLLPSSRVWCHMLVRCTCRLTCLEERRSKGWYWYDWWCGKPRVSLNEVWTSCNNTIAYSSWLSVFENHVQNLKMMQHRDALMKCVNTTSPYPPLLFVRRWGHRWIRKWPVFRLVLIFKHRIYNKKSRLSTKYPKKDDAYYIHHWIASLLKEIEIYLLSDFSVFPGVSFNRWMY